MKEYPSISGDIVNIPIYAFDKFDGNNIRAHWSKKRKSFNIFGSRHSLIEESSPILGEAVLLVKEHFERSLTNIFLNERYEDLTCFFEFYGKSSFAGMHNPNESHKVTLIDIFLDKRNEFIPPNEFVRKFEHLDTPNLVYYGKPSADFIESVKNGTLEGMGSEGVVCKGKPLKKDYPMTMFKIKTLEWIKKVHSLYSNDPKKLRELL